MRKNTEELLERLGETFERNIKEYLHWFFLFEPGVSILVAKLLGFDKELLGIILIAFTILVNFLLLLLWSSYESHKTKELRLFRTFFLDILPPIKVRRQLLINTEIAVVEDKETSYFHGELKKKFKTEPIEEGTGRKPIEDNQLTFRKVICESFNKDELDKETIEQKEDDFKESLINDLSTAKAVLVVRTPQLDEKNWAYKAVETWANNNSDSPCLFVVRKDQIYGNHPIADNYLWIDDNPKLVPWKLLQRARDRSSAWRSQASFNRAMVANIFGLLVMIFLTALFLIHNLEADIKSKQEKLSPVFDSQRGKYYKALSDLDKRKDDVIRAEAQNQVAGENHTESIDQIRNNIKDIWKEVAKETRNEYKISHTNLSMKENLEFSYWFRNTNQAQVFLTTEEHPEIDQFPMNEKTAIGCALSHPNHIAQWESPQSFIARWWPNGNKTSVFNFAGEEEEFPQCSTAGRSAKPIKAIACVSYNRFDDLKSNGQYTVGICVFSGSENKNIFMNQYDEFLENRSREFEKSIVPLIEKGEILKLITNMDKKISPIIANE
jgi:hypothetical protein